VVFDLEKMNNLLSIYFSLLMDVLLSVLLLLARLTQQQMSSSTLLLSAGVHCLHTYAFEFMGSLICDL
jgi:hypothetical protein